MPLLHTGLGQMVGWQRLHSLPAARHGVFRSTHHKQFVPCDEDLPAACFTYVVDQHKLCVIADLTFTASLKAMLRVTICHHALQTTIRCERN